MVGVCLTVIGILSLRVTLKNLKIYTDNLLAINALGYLISCMVSYISIRSKKKEKNTCKTLNIKNGYKNTIFFICVTLLLFYQ